MNKLFRILIDFFFIIKYRLFFYLLNFIKLKILVLYQNRCSRMSGVYKQYSLFFLNNIEGYLENKIFCKKLYVEKYKLFNFYLRFLKAYAIIIEM